MKDTVSSTLHVRGLRSRAKGLEGGGRVKVGPVLTLERDGEGEGLGEGQ
jgi:hypothetical protein